MTEEAKLTVFIPKELEEGETRVAATPETVKTMLQHHIEVHLEAGSGENSYYPDEEYKNAGAIISHDANKLYSIADIILSINPPTHHQIPHLKQKSCWISFVDASSSFEIIPKLIEKNITCFSMNLIPRISRAQKMDALTSQANIGGYKAVIMAANEIGKIFPLMMTAAGTMHPAKVVILGAGVAGLQAIATAKRLGAIVEASDVRPSVKEQVESLGGKFIEVPFDKDAEDKGGYAKQASPEFLKRQAEEVSKRVNQADAVICTALVPGKKAPILVTEAMVKSMRPGSVIVDMAAVQGGNCELTEPGETTLKHGVTIIGVKNIPATVQVHATQMYSKNILALLLNIVREGKLHIHLDDEIIAGSLVTHEGKIINENLAKEFQKLKGDL